MVACDGVFYKDGDGNGNGDLGYGATVIPFGFVEG